VSTKKDPLGGVPPAFKQLTTPSAGEALRQLRSDLEFLNRLETEINHRELADKPTTYGLPDLNREQREDETQEEYIENQNQELRDFITKLYIPKDGRKVWIKLSPAMLEFIADMFYGRQNQAILWKGRGTGGSLCTAILMWLCLIYKSKSFTLMAGSSEQAKQMYQYTKGLWDCFPEMARNMLAAEPLQTETRLVNGTLLKIISASEKQARGKHNAGFVVDESCQEGEGTDRMISAAMQGAMSEPDYMIIMLSTFHHPIGLFQEVWDFADERGFGRYKWDVYDSMQKCDAGMETATKDDPCALEYCQTKCSLTEKKSLFDDMGDQISWKWRGCNGRARESQGFLPRKNVLIAKKMNRGTNVFAVEFENERPNWMRPVYDIEWVERSFVDADYPPPGTKILEKSVGIDWGLEGQTAMILSALCDVPTGPPLDPTSPNAALREPPYKRCVIILETEFMTGKLCAEAIRVLWGWAERFGQEKFYVYGDASHPFNNLEVSNEGFDCRPVPFNKWKDFGIGNCIKYFTNPGRLFIRRSLTGFLEQLKRYRQNKQGKPVKKDDHGPDAFLCAMIHFRFEERFAGDLELTPEELGEDVPDINYRPNFEGMAAANNLPFTIPDPPQTSVPVAQIGNVKTKRTSDGQVVVV
jgi:hypothetical protein